MRLKPSRKKDGDDALFVFCEQAIGRWYRAAARAIPHGPRCKLCLRPFGGLGRVLPGGGFSPSRKNPNFCKSCFEQAPVGCREIEIGVLFADVRGYTALSESRPAAERLCHRLRVRPADLESWIAERTLSPPVADPHNPSDLPKVSFMTSEGGTSGHARSRKGTDPLQMSLFEATDDGRKCSPGHDL